ncbi:MAG: 50S ribosomal protein L19 [bacterium]
MKQSLQEAIQDELPDANYPDFEPGDKIRVTTTQEIQGQQRERHFEGVCIARRGEGPDKTFKVRKVSFGVGVERIFPLHSPIIDKIEIVKKGKVRRAKLTYLEGRSAKDSRIEEERVDLEELNRTDEVEDSQAEDTGGSDDVDEDAEQTADEEQASDDQEDDDTNEE